MRFQPHRRAVPCLLLILLPMPGSHAGADEAGAIRAYERAKQSEPTLIAFLTQMPKGGDLHNHAVGAIYAEAELDSAIASGLFFDPATTRFYTDSAPGRAPAAQLLTNGALLSQFLQAASMAGWLPAKESGHDHFFNAFATLGSAIQKMTSEELLAQLLRRYRDQNLQYAEIMTNIAPADAMAAVTTDAPSVDDLPSALAILRPRLAAFVPACRAYLDERDRVLTDALGCPSSITGAGGPINVRYIQQANRTGALETFFATIAAAFAVMQQDRRVVAINIVAPEDHPNARRNFQRQMEIIDFLWR
ncbi:MAG TPA: hypothetical protein VGQ73_04550, partial [Gemmatimonadales bacterium]|nr:hypothetical protein [Gemmatimonadales bacterium]